MGNFGFQTLLFLAVCAIGAGQTKIKETPVKLSGTTDGAELYREHCAVCHGVEAKGAGPAARALKNMPTDLTILARNNGGKFPAFAVQQKIKGGEIIEHGTVDMPMWGKLLIPAGKGPADAQMRIYALMRYLEQIQAK
jgi:mono/diheme cytochrome c family protein